MGVNDVVQVLVSWCVQPIYSCSGLGSGIQGLGWQLRVGVSLLPKTFYLIPGYVFNDGASKREIASKRHRSIKSCYLHTLDQKPIRVTSERERENK